MTPPARHPAARRARQLPACQLPPGHNLVTVYREHDASKRQPSGPPRGLAKDHGEGRAISDPPTVPAQTKKGNPAGLPSRTRNTSDADRRYRPVTSSARCRRQRKPPPHHHPAHHIGIPNAATRRFHRNLQRRATLWDAWPCRFGRCR
jgi:hypothetical protein